MRKNIYGWVMDNRSRARRDFRIAGVRNNENGRYLEPEMPELPPGYPDKAPENIKKRATNFKRVDDSKFEFNIQNAEFADCKDDLIFKMDEWCQYMDKW